MAIHSGRFGKINNIPSVADWQINDNGSLAQWRNSGTQAGVGRKKAITSWAGGYNAHGAQPAVLPGDIFSFLGFTAPDDNTTRLGAGLTYGGTAIVDSVNVNWDWAGGQVIQHAVGFSGHLALTQHDADSTTFSDVVSDPESTNGCVIKYSADGGTTWTVLDNVTNAALSIVAANSSYVNSSTSGTTGRLSGPIDWQAQISVENHKYGAGLTKGSSYVWRLYTSDTHFYELKWGSVKEDRKSTRLNSSH